MGAVRSLRFSPDGSVLAAAEPADFVDLFDVASNYESRQSVRSMPLSGALYRFRIGQYCCCYSTLSQCGSIDSIIVTRPRGLDSCVGVKLCMTWPVQSSSGVSFCQVARPCCAI